MRTARVPVKTGIEGSRPHTIAPTPDEPPGRSVQPRVASFDDRVRSKIRFGRSSGVGREVIEDAVTVGTITEVAIVSERV